MNRQVHSREPDKVLDPDIASMKENTDIGGLIRTLRHHNLDKQWQAAETLTDIGRAHLDHLLKAVGDRDIHIRLGAIEVLGEIGDPRAIPQLLPFLEDSSNEVRLQTALALGEIGDSATIEPLIPLLRDPDKYVRYGGAVALTDLQWSPDDRVHQAYLALGLQNWERMKDLGRDAIPALGTALKDRDSLVRRRAIELLQLVGSEEAIPSIYEGLRDEDDQVRWSAVLAAPACGVAPHYIPRGLRRRPQRRKNPKVAAILNFILPGMGYTYLGRWWGLLIFQADVTISIMMFGYTGEITTYGILFPVYAILAIHAAYMALKMPEFS